MRRLRARADGAERLRRSTSSPGLNSTKYLRQTNSCLSKWSAFSLETRSWALDTRPLSVAPAWDMMVDTSICSQGHFREKKKKKRPNKQTNIGGVAAEAVGAPHLLTCDQVYAALLAVGHLPAQVIEDQQLAPAALQQHHLVLHLCVCA